MLKEWENDTVWRRVVEVDLLTIWQKIHDADAAPAIFFLLSFLALTLSATPLELKVALHW